MGQHFSKRRRKKSKTNSVISPTTIPLKEKILVDLDIMNEQLEEIRNERHRPPTPSPRFLKDSSEQTDEKGRL